MTEERSKIPLAVILVVLLAVIADSSFGQSLSVAFEGDRERPTNEGHVTLSWQVTGGGVTDDETVEYVIESALDELFTDTVVRYDGLHRQYFVSGLEDGDHYFRVRARRADKSDDTWGPWADAVLVKVEHQPLSRAWLFFVVGAVLFFSIVAFVAYHARAEGRGEAAYFE